MNAISISDMDTVRTQAGMLSMLTRQIDEISRMSEVNILCIKIDFKLSIYLNLKIISFRLLKRNFIFTNLFLPKKDYFLGLFT